MGIRQIKKTGTNWDLYFKIVFDLVIGIHILTSVEQGKVRKGNVDYGRACISAVKMVKSFYYLKKYPSRFWPKICIQRRTHYTYVINTYYTPRR